MADTAYWYCYLNTPTNQQVTSFILHQFEALWDKYDIAAVGGRVDKVCAAVGGLHGDVGCCKDMVTNNDDNDHDNDNDNDNDNDHDNDNDNYNYNHK